MLDVSFGFGAKLDSGVSTCVAINDDNVVIEVHKSEGASTLWYRTGIVAQATVIWQPSTHYDDGLAPSCAIDATGRVLEVHQSQWRSRLFARLGRYDEPSRSIVWLGPAHDYDDGWSPHVALAPGGNVVEVHQSNGLEELYFRVGAIESVNGVEQIAWRPSHHYDHGVQAKVAVDSNLTVVEVHKSGSANTLWCRVGRLNIAQQTIDWLSGPTHYDDGTSPTVALGDDGTVIEVHTGPDNILWSRVGKLIDNAIKWSPARLFDDGHAASVACNNRPVRVAIQTHASEISTSLWFSTSLVIDRAQWMRDHAYSRFSLPFKHARPKLRLRDLAIPGAHDAGMIQLNLRVTSVAAFTQSLDFLGQLQEGVRYFDLRPAESLFSPEFVFYHGLGSNKTGRTEGAKLTSLIHAVRTFLQSDGADEFVILKFSHVHKTISDNDLKLIRDMLTVHEGLGPYLFTPSTGSQLPRTILADCLLDDLKGKALILWDTQYPGAPSAMFEPTTSGIFRYDDVGELAKGADDVDPTAELHLYDVFADSPDYGTMRDDQREKYQRFDPAQFGASAMFCLDWANTPRGGTYFEIWTMGREANASLGSEVATLCAPNPKTGRINVVYTDFVQQARSTDVCLYLNEFVDARAAAVPRISGTVHVETLGDQPLESARWAGTLGQGRRLEAFKLELPPAAGLGIEYMAHIQDLGDQPGQGPWMSGDFVGTSGQSKRLEGFAIRLTGAAAVGFDVMYEAVLDGSGRTAPGRNGEFCGTRNESRRCEAIRVWLEKKQPGPI